MTSNKNDIPAIPSKTKLIVLTSLAITIFFGISRIGLIIRAERLGLPIQVEIIDMLVRTVYTFLASLAFFWVNLEFKSISLSSKTIYFSTWKSKTALNITAFFVVIFMLGIIHRGVVILLVPGIEKGVRAFAFGNILVQIFAVLGSYIYELIFENHQMALKNTALQKQNADARYETLKNQLNPHFLFNSFNTLNSLITESREKATEFVNNMSDVYRYVLQSSKKDITTVGEELSFLDSYSDMLLKRHNQKLTIDIDVERADEDYLIVPMALQILVENAVKHNVISAGQPLHIKIFSKDGSIVVQNDLQRRRTSGASNGIGLFNLNKRYEYLSGKNIIIKEEDTNNTFTVKIPLLHHEDIDH